VVQFPDELEEFPLQREVVLQLLELGSSK